jgi:hypothetical protein
MTLGDEPLDDDVRELLSCEASSPDPSAAHVDRARRRLKLQLGIGAAAGAAMSKPAIEPTPPDAVSRPSVSVVSALSGAKVGAVGALIFLAGTATGWFARGTVQVAQPIAPSIVAAPRASAGASVEPSIEPPPPVAPSSARAVNPPSRPPSPRASGALTVSENERALLDQAKRAVREGDAERALALVAKHEHDYPRGTLDEERDVLRVSALVAAGRRDDAVAAAEKFRRQYPASLFLRAVESQVEPR